LAVGAEGHVPWAWDRAQVKGAGRRGAAPQTRRAATEPGLGGLEELGQPLGEGGHHRQAEAVGQRQERSAGVQTVHH